MTVDTGDDWKPSILILARHFPPLISGGARRPYLLAQALGELGCPVFVAAPALPAGIRGVVVPHPHPDPSTGAVPPNSQLNLRRIARDWLLWPDADIRWARRAAKAVKKSGFRPDWIVTTSPPESLHAVAPDLKVALKARWLADVRDEWLAHPLLKVRRNPIRNLAERLWARRLLTHADAVTCVDLTVAREVEALAPEKPILVVGQFARPVVAPVALDGVGPHLIYTGSFSLSDPKRRIEPTLNAFSAAWMRRPSLKLHIAGRLTDEEVSLVEQSPASKGGVKLYGPLCYDETLALQAAADGFIVTGAPKSTAVPGKVYEYRITGAPIIAVGFGPWRKIGGYDDGDAVERMVGLNVRAQTGYNPPTNVLSPIQAAMQFLELMNRATTGNIR